MTEFKIINDYIKRENTDSSVTLGIGDDCAVMDVPTGQQIVQTMDTMVLGVHFDAEFSADALACLLYTSPSPRDQRGSRMPSSA